MRVSTQVVASWMIALSLAGCTCTCCELDRSTPRLTAAQTEPSEEAFQVFRLLHMGPDSTAFWANEFIQSRRDDVDYRRRCLICFFESVRSPIEATTLSKELGSWDWLKEENIHYVRALAGHLGVPVRGGDSTFVIHAEMPDETNFDLLLYIAGKVTEHEVYRALAFGENSYELRPSIVCICVGLTISHSDMVLIRPEGRVEEFPWSHNASAR